MIVVHIMLDIFGRETIVQRFTRLHLGEVKMIFDLNPSVLMTILDPNSFIFKHEIPLSKLILV